MLSPGLMGFGMREAVHRGLSIDSHEILHHAAWTSERRTSPPHARPNRRWTARAEYQKQRVRLLSSTSTPNRGGETMHFQAFGRRVPARLRLQWQPGSWGLRHVQIGEWTSRRERPSSGQNTRHLLGVTRPSTKRSAVDRDLRS